MPPNVVVNLHLHSARNWNLKMFEATFTLVSGSLLCLLLSTQQVGMNPQVHKNIHPSLQQSSEPLMTSTPSNQKNCILDFACMTQTKAENPAASSFNSLSRQLGLMLDPAPGNPQARLEFHVLWFAVKVLDVKILASHLLILHPLQVSKEFCNLPSSWVTQH